MTEKGFIIGRPIEGISLNGLEYLLDDERNGITHFDTEEEARRFMAEHGIDEEDIILQYHIFCRHCAKEFFFETDAIPKGEDRVFYVCTECKRIIENKINNKH